MKFLVLSGGASKGAFQSGVLDHLINDLNISYDGFCGVSVGALNCSFLCQFKDDKKAIEELKDFWLRIGTENIYKRWFPFGRLSGLWKDSLYDSQPLIDLVHSSLDLNLIRQSGKKCAVGAVSLSSGKYKIFTQDDDFFVDGVLASAAFPAAFKPITIQDEEYTDGGVKHITPLKAAIEMGATEIDVILCSPKATTSTYDKDSNALSIAFRSIELMTDQLMESDLYIANLYNKMSLSHTSDKKFVKINIIRPSFSLTNDSLSFDHDEIVRMMDIGYKEAIKQYNS